MMVGEGGRRSRSPVSSATIVVVEIAVVAAAAAAVIVIVGVAPRWSGVDGLHRDLGSGLGRGVEGLSPGVVLGPELNCRLHGDLGLLGKAMAAVGRRGATVTRGRCAVRGGWGMIGRGRAVATTVRAVQVCMRLDLDHAIGTRAIGIKREKDIMSKRGGDSKGWEF